MKLKRVFLDTEFNGFGGELISMALVTEDGLEWYAALDYAHMDLNPWVAENVIPKLAVKPMNQGEFLLRFHSFAQLNCREAEIIADWPADFTHFNRLMDKVGEQLGFMLPMPYKMSLIESGPYLRDERYEHNALYDARALKDWYVGQDKKHLEVGLPPLY